MTSDNNIVGLYKQILTFLGLEADDSGAIRLNLLGATDPATITQKRLLLPTQDRLRTYDAEKEMFFHPLCESAHLGPSPVLNFCREILNARFDWSLKTLSQSLLDIVAKPDRQSQLKGDQLQLLQKLTGADAKAAEAFIKLVKASSENAKTAPFVHLYLPARGAKLGSINYNAACLTSFPVYTELTKPGDKVLGVKVTAAQRKVFQDVMAFILPAIDEKEAYSIGSVSPIAPHFDALCQTAIRLATAFNEIATLYKPFLCVEGGNEYDLAFAESVADMEKLQPLIRRLPSLSGNAGVIPPSEEAAPVATTAPPRREAEARRAPESRRGSDGLNVRELLDREQANRRYVEPEPRRGYYQDNRRFNDVGPRYDDRRVDRRQDDYLDDYLRSRRR